MKPYIPIVVVTLIGVGAFIVLSNSISYDSGATQTSATPFNTNIPTFTLPQKVQTAKTQTPTKTIPLSTLPSSIILKDVQFASQAPLRNWDLPFQDFCEEASSLIAAFYALGKKVPSAEDISTELLRIKDFEDKNIGHYEDTTALETTRILKEFYGLTDVTLIQNPTIEDLKTQLAQGKVIMVPSAGRMLGNPYFHAPGPLYHMLVIKGYTPSGYFITEDPGTNTKGENYTYKFATIMNAMHDWNGDDMTRGAKVVIAVGKQK